ncbi:MAG: hypothetical protein PHP50_14075 [Lachnospiraceae bacterium]|nr:hypothetical protein [Lachnospiraceae bacterium]
MQIIHMEEYVEKKREQRIRDLEYAKEILEERYGMEMVIFRMWQEGILENDYWVEASPKKNEDVRYLAQVLHNGQVVKDQYSSRRMAQRIEDLFTDAFVKTIPVFSVKVGLADKWHVFKEEKPEQLCSTGITIFGMLYLDILQEEENIYSPQTIYTALAAALETIPFFAGQIMVSVVSVPVFSGILVYLREHANVNNTYLQLKKDYDTKTFPFSKGKLDIGQEEFFSAYRG